MEVKSVRRNIPQREVRSVSRNRAHMEVKSVRRNIPQREVRSVMGITAQREVRSSKRNTPYRKSYLVFYTKSTIMAISGRPPQRSAGSSHITLHKGR